jgi:hypothetical protein
MEFKVSAFSVDEDWIIADAFDSDSGKTSITHVYPAIDNAGQPWIAAIDTCCRIGGLSNQGSGYRVETLVDLDTTIGSPLSNLPPIIACQTNSQCGFIVPASAPGSDTVTWRLATSAESGGLIAPAGLSVDAITGQVSWDTNGLQPQSLWAAQIVIESRDLVTNALVGKASVDFIIRIVDEGLPPEIIPPPNSTPICNASIPAQVDNILTFDVSASDSDPADSITLNTAGLPTGAVMSPSLPLSGNPVSSTFSWTPTADDIGTTIITFTATDQLGLQALCPVTVEVSASFPGIDVGGSSQGALAPGLTEIRPQLGKEKRSFFLDFSSDTDFRVLLPKTIIQRSVGTEEATYDITVQNNWDAWYYVTNTATGLVAQTAPGAFMLPPGEKRSFRLTFARGDRIRFFANAGFNTDLPPVDEQDAWMLTAFSIDFLWRAIQGSRLPYNVIDGFQDGISVVGGAAYGPFFALGANIGTGNLIAILDDIRKILNDPEAVQVLVTLGFDEKRLASWAEGFSTVGFGLRIYFVLEFLINELIAATTRPFGDLTFEAR